MAALAKAEEHLSAAEAIASTGNFGLGFSHLVLGLEEWAKNQFLFADELGFVRWGTPDMNDPLRIPRSTLTNHDKKQMAALGSICFMYPYRARVRFISDRLAAGRPPSQEEVTENFRQDCEVAKVLASYIPRLEDMKQAGFYSGDTTSKGHVARPGNEEEFRQIREILSGLLEFGRWAAEHPPTAAESKERLKSIKKTQAEFRRIGRELLKQVSKSKD